MRTRLKAGPVALAAAFLASVFTVSATPAGAETTPATAGVTTQAVFNNPIGTVAEQRAIVDKQIELIGGAPAGSLIRLSYYYLNDPDFADALIAAHDRGVRVQAIFDEKALHKEYAPIYSRLAEKLGSDPTEPSFLMTCGTGRGCVGTRMNNGVVAINHNKFMLFTETQGTERVVVQSSANLHTGRDGRLGWNNALVLAGNDAIYEAYKGYFEDLRARIPNNDYYRTGRPPLASGNAKIHFFPRAEAPGKDFYADAGEDTIATILNNVQCHGNSVVGTTDTHRTRIRVSMTAFARPYLASKLNELDAAGCYVEVALTYSPPRDDGKYSFAEDSLNRLLGKTSSPYGGVITKYYCGEDATWIHDKFLLVEGKYYNAPDRKIVWTGSHNLTTNSLRQSDETLLQLEDPAVHDAYVRQYNKLRAATTHQPANGTPIACPRTPV
ncbi:phosphatidylserine/phosphatidylglycerophosphate/cardiolipin synthase family protein [Streptomyces sp. NPDC058855]|uniref:phospholipase D-like domain-containing protein n=1 Tax=Streptomyces sp. NPDC058855 TaxID=3346651 RepID=UPI00367EC29F